MSLRSRSGGPQQPSSADADIPSPPEEPKPAITATPSLRRQQQQSLSQAFATTAHLANLLPTGTLLALQLLGPVFTNHGACDPVTRALTHALLFFLSASCFLLSLTDSLRGPDGAVYYGFATPRGLWLLDFPDGAPVPDLSHYRLRAIDFVHGALSVLVFGAVAMRDADVVGCLFPRPDTEVRELLTAVPLGIGVLCGMVFAAFPTRRHGIGYPVTNGQS